MCVQTVYRLCTVCTDCVQTVYYLYRLCTDCVQCVQTVYSVYRLCTVCVQTVYRLCDAGAMLVDCLTHWLCVLTV